MKLSDIKVGTAYADTWGRKWTVLEVGVKGWAHHGRMGVSKSYQATYVRVDGKHQSPIHCRNIKRTWREQEAIDKTIDLVNGKAEERVTRVWDILEEHAGLKRPDWKDTQIVFSVSDVEQICRALTKPRRLK